MELLRVQWSVGIEVTGDEVMTPDRICDLADAVASASGDRLGDRSAVLRRQGGGGGRRPRTEAVAKATGILRSAARTAALPEWPISRVEVVSEDEEE